MQQLSSSKFKVLFRKNLKMRPVMVPWNISCHDLQNFYLYLIVWRFLHYIYIDIQVLQGKCIFSISDFEIKMYMSKYYYRSTGLIGKVKERKTL